METWGRPLLILERIRRDYPLALHGVSLSIGSAEGLRAEYLAKLKALVDRVEPFIVSDHLCWTGAHASNVHDLLPVPFTGATADWIVSRIQRVQEFLGRPIAIENVSSYLVFPESEMTEWDFLSEVSRRSGCGILLDVNNVYVSAQNHRFDARAYLASIPLDRVRQIHLAGHTDTGDFLFDTHSRPVAEPVWDLYAEVMAKIPHVPTLIEWDDDIPEFGRLDAEAGRAVDILKQLARRERAQVPGEPHVSP
jgi:uncharacterized protein (UPF0276 family)